MKTEDVEEAVAVRKENILATLAGQETWKVLKEHIDSEIDKLDGLNKAQIEAGASFEEIGRNTVLIQLCKEELQSIINKVEDAQDSRQPGTK